MCCLQWTVLGPPGRCGLTARRLVVGAHTFEPAPASTPHHETMVLTAVGQRKKHRSVRPLPAWVCVLRQGKKTHVLSNQREFNLLLYQQMTFALGLLGHRAPRRAGRGLYHDTGRACASREEMRRVPLRSRPRGTVWRRSCATNSPVQVLAHKTLQRVILAALKPQLCLCCVLCVFLRRRCN